MLCITRFLWKRLFGFSLLPHSLFFGQYLEFISHSSGRQNEGSGYVSQQNVNLSCDVAPNRQLLESSLQIFDVREYDDSSNILDCIYFTQQWSVNSYCVYDLRQMEFNQKAENMFVCLCKPFHLCMLCLGRVLRFITTMCLWWRNDEASEDIKFASWKVSHRNTRANSTTAQTVWRRLLTDQKKKKKNSIYCLEVSRHGLFRKHHAGWVV